MNNKQAFIETYYLFMFILYSNTKEYVWNTLFYD
jgi:hypothetical protein